VATLIKSFNRAYDVEETRSWLTKKALSVGLTLLLAVLVNAAFVMLITGGQLGQWVADKTSLGSTFQLVWGILYWFLAVLFIIFVLALLYFLGPNVEQSFRWISPGSVVATLAWVLIALGFRLYLLFSDPGSAYGALGSIVVLMFFLYLTGIAFVLGAEVNAIVGPRYDPEVVEDLAQHPQKLETVADQAAAETRARELDARDGTNVPSQAKRQSFPVGRKAANSAPGDASIVTLSQSQHTPTRGERVMASLGGLLVAVLLMVVRRKTEKS